MPSINQDILYEIWLKTIQNEKNLIKFMLAGKEPIKLVMNYFSLPKDIQIGYEWLDIDIKYGHGKSKHLWVEYDSFIFKFFLSRICSFIDELTIRDWPREKIILTEEFKKLIGGDYKTFNYLNQDPYIHYEMEELISQFGDIQIFKTSRSLFHEMAFIPSSCSGLNLNLIDFQTFFKKVKNHGIFPNIEKLVISNTSKFLNFISSDVQKFSFLIGQNFPHLSTIDVKLRFKFHYIAFQNIQNLNSRTFKGIPLNVKGIILFGWKFDLKHWPQFIEDVRKDLNMKVAETDQEIIVLKEFEIHPGLNFKFYGICKKPLYCDFLLLFFCCCHVLNKF